MIPVYLKQQLETRYGPEKTEESEAGMMMRRTSLRVNRLKSSREEAEAAFLAAGIPWEHVSWFPDAYLLPHAMEPALQQLPIYAAGGIYLQSLSSMLPPILLGANPGEDVLDMAAAPGGKTTEIASLTDGKALITACERNAVRAERLRANLLRQGATKVTVMQTDARDLPDFFSFDRVLLDAPCSGSGTWLPGSKGRFEEALLKHTAALQDSLLKKALSLVRPGGIVVYSTCSIFPQENEEIVSRALKRGGCVLIPVEEERFADIPRLPCLLPQALLVSPTEEYEGFFAAILQRT